MGLQVQERQMLLYRSFPTFITTSQNKERCWWLILIRFSLAKSCTVMAASIFTWRNSLQIYDCTVLTLVVQPFQHLATFCKKLLTLLKKIDVNNYINKGLTGSKYCPLSLWHCYELFSVGFESTVWENHGFGHRRASLASSGTRRRSIGNREGFQQVCIKWRTSQFYHVAKTFEALLHPPPTTPFYNIFLTLLWFWFFFSGSVLSLTPVTLGQVGVCYFLKTN